MSRKFYVNFELFPIETHVKWFPLLWLPLTLKFKAMILTNLNYMSGTFHSKLSFSDPLALEKIFNDSIIFLHFYAYLPFGEDLAFHLIISEFPLFKDVVYQV
jgi:hypothetical protein